MGYRFDKPCSISKQLNPLIVAVNHVGGKGLRVMQLHPLGGQPHRSVKKRVQEPYRQEGNKANPDIKQKVRPPSSIYDEANAFSLSYGFRFLFLTRQQ